MTRFQLNVDKEYEVISVLDFIRTFNCEELARDLFKIPHDVKIEDWDCLANPWNISDEEVIEKLLEYLEGEYMYEYHKEGIGYFIIYKLCKKNPINQITKIIKEKVMFV